MRKATDGLKNVNNLLMSLLGTPRGSLVVKSLPISEDYKISTNVLGLGINGKVVECFDQVTGTAKCWELTTNVSTGQSEVCLESVEG